MAGNGVRTGMHTFRIENSGSMGIQLSYSGTARWHIVVTYQRDGETMPCHHLLSDAHAFVSDR